jgi:hypothetical protein
MSEDKKLSVSDFKNWLSGVLDFQDEDWTPNLDQWKKILTKIHELDETTVQPTQATPKVNAVKSDPKQEVSVPRNPRPQLNLPAELDKATTKLPDKPVISGEKSVEVIQAQQPSVREEGNQKIRDTGKIYKTKENQDADYESTFI